METPTSQEWISLCVVQVSLFIRKPAGWTAVCEDSNWNRAEFLRNGFDACKVVVECEPKYEIKLTSSSVLHLPAEDFVEIHCGVNNSTRYGMYFIDGDEASAFGAIVSSALTSLSQVTPKRTNENEPPKGSNRRPLSQFAEVNEAVQTTIESADGNYSSAVKQQQSSVLSRLTASASDIFGKLGSKDKTAKSPKTFFAESSEPKYVTAPSAAILNAEILHQRNRSNSVYTTGSAAVLNAFPRFFTGGEVEDAETSALPVVPTEISGPSIVRHDVRVSYDMYHARYNGLPPEWNKMNKSFGITYEESPKLKVAEYEARIPAVLEMLKRYLLEFNGQEVVGIFRLAASKDDIDKCKQQINTGQFNGCEDVHIIANLIKIFFRELPKSLLNHVHEKIIHVVADVKISEEGAYDSIMQNLEQFHDPYRTLFYWLLDLMALIVLHEDVNKMSARNIAIVLAPNLFSVNTENAMYALTMSQKVADFTTKCLAARLKLKHNYIAKI